MATSRLTTDEFQQSLTRDKAPNLLQRLLQAEMQPNEIAELLKCKNEDGWTLGIIIARHQKATTTQQYLRLLEKLSLEDLAAHLKCQNRYGNTLGMIIARYHDTTTTQHYLRLLEKLSLEDLAAHLKCQTDYGWTLGMIIARYHDTTTTQHYLRLLEKLSPQDLPAHLKWQNNPGSTLGIIIADHQDASTTQQYLRLLEKLSPEDFAANLKSQNKDGWTLGIAIARYHDTTTTQLFYDILIKQFQHGMNVDDINTILNQKNNLNKSIRDYVKDINAFQRFFARLQRICDAGRISTTFREINENKYPAEKLPSMVINILELHPEYLTLYLNKLEAQFNNQVEEHSRQKYRSLIAFVQLLINYPDRIDQSILELAANNNINLDEPYSEELRHYIEQRKQINRYVNFIHEKLNAIKININQNEWQIQRFGLKVNGHPTTIKRISKALELMKGDNVSILNTYRRILDLLAQRKKNRSSRAPETDFFYSTLEKELKNILFYAPDQASLNQLNPATQPPPTFMNPPSPPLNDPPAYEANHTYVVTPPARQEYIILPADHAGGYPQIIFNSGHQKSAEMIAANVQIEPLEIQDQPIITSAVSKPQARTVSTSTSSLFATPALNLPPVPSHPLPPVGVSAERHRVEEAPARQMLIG